MWDFAQNASPPFAVFSIGIAVIVWRQLLFERSEHRKAEKDFTGAATKLAVAVQALASAVEPPKRPRNRGRGR